MNNNKNKDNIMKQKDIYVCIKCKTTYNKPIQQNHGHPKGVCINCAIDDYNQSTNEMLNSVADEMIKQANGIDYNVELFRKRNNKKEGE